jgi:Ribbon-helix-helix protein
MKRRGDTHFEDRTARLTILIDPRKKAMFEQLCAAEDVTPSQLVRRLIRSYIEQRLGRPWTPVLQAAQRRRRSQGRVA